MIQTFETLNDYNAYTSSGATMESGILYYVKEDGSSHFLTNNIDGQTKEYNNVDPEHGYIIPSGNTEITENGTDIDVAQYATASVDVDYPDLVVKGIEYNSGVTGSGSFTSATTKNYIESVIIPDGYTSLFASFSNYNNLKGVVIPNTVTSIGSSSFRNCTSLTGITIPNGVTTIGEEAFQNCNSLTSLVIPDSVTTLGLRAFQSCTGVTSLVIGSGITTMGNGVFDNCKALTSVTINDGCQTIGNSCFSECSALTSIVIPNSVTSISDYAFHSCSALTSVTIGSGLTTIGENAFSTCRNLTSITIPDSVTSIGDSCFGQPFQGLGLTSLVIGSGITSIGNSAFIRNNLSSVTIYATTPPTLGTNAFKQNVNLAHIYVPAESVETYKAASGWSAYSSIIEAIPSEGGTVMPVPESNPDNED